MQHGVYINLSFKNCQKYNKPTKNNRKYYEYIITLSNTIK